MKSPRHTEIPTADLRALLFWAAVGVRISTTGSYENVIEEIIRYWAKRLVMNIRAVKFIGR